MSAPREIEALNEAVHDLRRQGYTIETDVPLRGVDKRFGSIRADVIARRGDEIVILEAKSQRSAPGSKLDQLAAIVEQIGDNVRLDVVWGGSVEPIPTAGDVSDLARRASDLVPVDKSAALLLAWAALEGGIRRCAVREGLEGSRTTGRQLLADLYGNRIITSALYDALDRVGRKRNLLAHGVNIDKRSTEPAVDVDEVAFVCMAASSIASDSYLSVDQVLELMHSKLDSGEIQELAHEVKWRRGLVDRVRRVAPPLYDFGSIREIAQELTDESGV